MRIAIGAVAGVTGGPQTFAIELVRALAALPGGNEIAVLTDRPDAFCDFAHTVHVPLGSAWGQPHWDHVGVPRALSANTYDVYHGTKGVLPRRLRIPGVVSIHDLAVNVMPATFSWPQRIHLRLETPATVRRAATIVTGSRSTQRDLARFYPASRGKTQVVPYAAAGDLRPPAEDAVQAFRRKYALSDVSVGYLGTIQPRKNIDVLADAFRTAAGDKPWQLLIAGRLRPGYRPACFDSADPRIRYLGELPEDELATYLAALDCMVSPSDYEGFGLTFIEAMAVGCPVIGVANSSVPEVVGDAGLLVAAATRAQLADAIKRVAGDPRRAAELSRRGVERAALYSWTETAAKMLAVYRSAAERNG